MENNYLSFLVRLPDESFVIVEPSFELDINVMNEKIEIRVENKVKG